MVALGLPALGQQVPQYYKKPETTAEYWRYMKHEIELGHFDLAAQYLKAFNAKEPSDEELLQLHDKEGSSAFLRLLNIPQMQDEAKTLTERVNAVVQKYLSDRKRLDALIKNLNASPEERSYAIAHLKRSGAAAVPALIDALLRSTGDTGEHSSILSALPKLDASTIPPLTAALDMEEPGVRGELMDVLRKQGAVSAAAYLWYLADSPKQPEDVRKKALETLAAFLDVSANHLPPGKSALTQQAERYYQHQVRFTDPGAVVVWRWEGKQLVRETLSASQAEEYYGLRFARQALDLDPSYRQAQVVFLSLALDKAFERSGVDQSLAKGAPAVKELLSSVSPDLVAAVLDKALNEHRLAVILGATRALGELAEVRAARPTGHGAPVLVRALNYPDRRVQMAAAEALLNVPTVPTPAVSARIVEVLRRAVAGDTAPRVLVVYPRADTAEAVAQTIQQAGFEPVLVHTGRAALQRLAEAADIDVLLIDAAVADPQLPYLLAQLRSDVDAGLLPLFVTTSPDRVQSLERLAERYRNVWILSVAAGTEELKQAFTSRISEVMGKPLSAVERKDQAAKAMEWLTRLARGELKGYDIRPATRTILQALRSKELGNLAVEAAGRLTGREAQRELAGLVLDQGQPAALRSAAAIELCRQIQQNGLVLTDVQVKSLQKLFETTDDAKLKGNVALVIGSLHPDGRVTGERLQRYRPTFAPQPTPPTPAPAPEEKKDSGSKDGTQD
jgi:CheY-like chemotaxis protein